VSWTVPSKKRDYSEQKYAVQGESMSVWLRMKDLLRT